MFYDCSALKRLDLTSFDTTNVADMGYMFTMLTYGGKQSQLLMLDLSSFNTQNAINMNHMFGGCQLLQTIYVSTEWKTAWGDASKNMFINCYALVGGEGTVYNYKNIDGTYGHIDGGVSNPGYLTAKS